MATPIKTATGSWRIQIEVRGERDSCTFPTKREAVEWAHRRSTEMRAMATGKAGTIKTLGDAMLDYADKVSPTKAGEIKEVIRLKAFARQEHFPVNVRLSELTAAHLVVWRDARLKINSRNSVLRDMTLLSHVLEIARREWRWIVANPMKDVSRPPEPDHREIVITGVQMRKMLRALRWHRRRPVRSVSHAVANAFLLALQTGARAGEICGLKWSDVGMDSFLVDGKTGRRHVPAVATTMQTIEAMRGYDDEYVFGLKPQSLDVNFRKYRDRAGLSGFTFHDTRHTAATRLAQLLHVLDLCKMFGWTNPKRAMVYYNPTAKQIAQRIAGITSKPVRSG
ncbi:MAG: site-specific integrase [Comamonadaceae bacterium]|nr:MAG: site-specific integrase [Comamonadaceae bacterium]